MKNNICNLLELYLDDKTGNDFFFCFFKDKIFVELETRKTCIYKYEANQYTKELN